MMFLYPWGYLEDPFTVDHKTSQYYSDIGQEIV